MNEQVFIKGTAIVEGVSRNGVMYSAEELNKFAPTLKGKPILKDHDSRTDNTIGKVTNTIAVNNGKIVTYEGWVKEDGTGIVEKIKDGRISEVSIGAIAKRMVREKDSDILIAEDITALELSTTPTPGVVGTSLGIRQSAKESKSINNNQNLGNERRSGNMSENQSNEISESKVLIESKDKEIATLKEVIRTNKISEYNKLCAEKKVKSLDMSKASIEVIEAMIAQIQLVEVAIPTQAVAKSEMKSEIAEKQEFEKKGLVIERSIDGNGFAMWEMPDMKKLRMLHSNLPFLNNGR